MKYTFKIHLILFLTISLNLLLAQQRYNVSTFDGEAKFNKTKLFDVNQSYDSVYIENSLHNFITEQRMAGYAFANLDSIKYINNSCLAYINIGKKYALNITSDNQALAIMNLAGIQQDRLIAADSSAINQISNSVLRYLNNHGFPFAAVGIYEPIIKDSLITVNLKVEKGSLILIDSIKYHDSIKINSNYLYKYLEIKKGSVYEHQKLLGISKKLQELTFLETDSLPQFRFVNDKLIINLTLKPKPANKFDFLIGFLPGNENTKFRINGELSAELTNRLGQGENLNFKWKRLTSKDQQIQFYMDYPYVLNSNFGITSQFDLFLNNNTSTDVNALLGGNYLFTGNNIVKASWSLKSSNLVNIDTSIISASKRLPQKLDFAYNGIYFGYQIRKLNYRFNPISGFEINSFFNLGLRSVKKNTLITEIAGFQNSYDTIKLNSILAEFNVQIAKYIPFKKWAAFKLSVTSAAKFTNSIRLLNEAYRIGGNRILRGFDELSIDTYSYLLFSSEFKIVLDKNSFLSFPFIDLARLTEYKNKELSWKTACSIGIGLNFSTRAGIFNFSFAAGNNLSGLPDFGNTRIHFGYLNLF